VPVVVREMFSLDYSNRAKHTSSCARGSSSAQLEQGGWRD